MKKLLTIAFIFILVGCGEEAGKKLDGSYASAVHTWTFTFKTDGTVDLNSPTKKLSEKKYTIEGNKITIEGNPFPFSLKENGNIDGGTAYGMLVKK